MWEERVRDTGVRLVDRSTKNVVDVRRAQNSAQAAIRLLSNYERFHLRMSFKQKMKSAFGFKVSRGARLPIVHSEHPRLCHDRANSSQQPSWNIPKR